MFFFCAEVGVLAVNMIKFSVFAFLSTERQLKVFFKLKMPPSTCDLLIFFTLRAIAQTLKDRNNLNYSLIYTILPL